MLPRLGWVPSLVATALVSLTQATPLNSGVAPFPYGNETFETYYEVFGLQGSQNTPLIVLHGGPGLSHDYLEVFCDLSSSRPIILYDQIGNARSTHLDAKPSSFWTIDLFVKQLESLVSHFGLDDYGVLGHSWGGMLAAEFAVTQPNGLKTLVLSNSPPSAQLWAQSQTQLISTFPPEVQQAIANGYSDPNYKEALLGYFHVHGCTLNPWPRGLDVSFGFTFSDPTVDVQMWYVIVGDLACSHALKFAITQDHHAPEVDHRRSTSSDQCPDLGYQRRRRRYYEGLGHPAPPRPHSERSTPQIRVLHSHAVLGGAARLHGSCRGFLKVLVFRLILTPKPWSISGTLFIYLFFQIPTLGTVAYHLLILNSTYS